MRKFFLPAILCLLFSFKCVFINAQTSFTNSTAITIPVVGPASPYPFNIVVAGYDNQPGASDAANPTTAVGANSIIFIQGTATGQPLKHRAVSQ